MTNSGQNIGTLIAVAKRLHASPLPGSERACLVRMPDGTERLALTRLVTTKQHGTEHNGASFYRVSFKFADGEADYSQEHDVVWCIIDHRNGNIVFGPTEGILISERGLGIGSYLLAQVIRLLQQAELHGHYQVQQVQLPVKAQEQVGADEAEDNKERIEKFLTRAGFYVSPAGGVVTVGVRKQKDLKSWWNQERVKFLGFPQFVELASRWRSEKLQAETLLAAGQEVNAGLVEQVSALQRSAQAAAAERIALEDQHRAAIDQLVQRVAEAEQSAKQAAEELAVGAAAAPAACSPVAAQGPQSLTIGLSPALMRLLWAGLGVVAAALLVSAGAALTRGIG